MADSDSYDEIESDNDFDMPLSSKGKNSRAERRAHHNALEWKRRNELKRKFLEAKNSFPSLRGVKKVSRATILMKLTSRICKQRMRLKDMFQTIEKYGQKNHIPDIRERLIETEEKRKLKNPNEFYNKVIINIKLKDFKDTEIDSYSYLDSTRLIQFFRSFIEIHKSNEIRKTETENLITKILLENKLLYIFLYLSPFLNIFREVQYIFKILLLHNIINRYSIKNNSEETDKMTTLTTI